MTYNFEWTEGFDKYGVTGTTLSSVNQIAGDWTTLTTTNTAVTFQASLLGNGASLNFSSTGTSGIAGPVKTLPANYARSLGSAYIKSNIVQPMGFKYLDGATVQFTLQVNSSTGTISGIGGTTNTSSASVVANSIHCLQWDITFHNSAGILKVWLDGVSIISVSGINTRAGTANNYVNGFQIFHTNAAGGPNTTFDHIWLAAYTVSGGTDTPPLTNPIIETQFPIGDSSVQFTPTNSVLGQDYSITASTNAPGANEIFLRKFTPVTNCTINSVSILPAATSVTAKFKAVIYADSAGVPNGAALSSGTEVVGCTSGTTLTGNLVTPQSLTSGTPYWIGFITDTSIVLSEVDSTTSGGKAVNTYTSGAPTTPILTTGQPSWIIFGNCTAPATNWPQVGQPFSNPQLGDLQYNTDSTVGHEDLFSFPALSANAQIVYTVGVKGCMERSDAGARTIDLRLNSSGSDSGGSSTGQTPATSYGWLSSYFDLDPNGSVAWTVGATNAATSGLKIAS